MHTFFHCPFFKDIWREEPFNLTSEVQATNFATGLNWLRSKLEAQLFGLACVVVWNVSNFRNGLLHGGERGDRASLVTRSNDYLDSFRSAQICFPVPKPSNPIEQWPPPKQPFIKVNFDAAIIDSIYNQVGVVARDGTGYCLRWSVKLCRGSFSPEIAEVCAARQALVMAKDMG